MLLAESIGHRVRLVNLSDFGFAARFLECLKQTIVRVADCIQRPLLLLNEVFLGNLVDVGDALLPQERVKFAKDSGQLSQDLLVRFEGSRKLDVEIFIALLVKRLHLLSDKGHPLASLLD